MDNTKMCEQPPKGISVSQRPTIHSIQSSYSIFTAAAGQNSMQTGIWRLYKQVLR